MPPPTFLPEVVNINVDFDGTVYWNGNFVAQSGRSRQATRCSRLSAGVGRKPVETQSEIHLTANRLVIYEHVARVLATAQRLGVVKIGLVGSEQFLE